MNVNLKYLNALAKHIAPKTEIRYHLVSVQFEVTDAGRYYVATDGHKLVAIRESRQDGDVNGEYLIPREVIMGIKLEPREVIMGIKLDKRYKVEMAEFQCDNGKASITYCGTETRFGLVDGKFPDWRRVIPATTSGEIAQYNPDYLVSVRDCAAATVGIGKYSGLYMAHNGNSAGLYQANSVDFIGVIMPLRVDRSDSYIPAPTDLHINWGLSKPLQAVA